MKKNLILLGFMGSGKSSTGTVLAGRLGCPFVDTDALIESRAGLRVHEIFKERGEAAFRTMERELLDEVLLRGTSVIAIGGGMWMDPENRRRLLENGWCVWLRVGASQAWNRVRGDLGQRPLLAAAPDPLARIHELLQARTPLYALAHASVDTDGLSPEQAAEIIVRKMKE